MSWHVTRIACVFHSVTETKIPVSLTAHAMIIVSMDVMVVAMISVHSARNQRYEIWHGPSTVQGLKIQQHIYIF